MDHPFEEYHEDASIGNLMWRIDRRRELLADSQDGWQIDELERKLKSDRKELAELKAAYLDKETP
jgi:hypothetical protein